MRAVVVLTLAIAASAVFASPALAQEATAVGQSATAVNRPAPSLTLPDLSGAEQSLASFRGRIVVLTFWETSCPACRQEASSLVSLKSEFAAWGVEVVGVSTDAASARAEVVKFVREQKINYPVWLGATAADLERFGVGPAPPATIILDGDGRVVARFGSAHHRDVRKQVEALVAKAREGSGEVARTDHGNSDEGAARVPS